MAMYEWICRDCSIWWDREYDLGKAPKRTKCPKCGTLSNRYWQQQNVGVSFKDDGAGNNNGTGGAMDFHTVRRRYQKFQEEGYDQQSADRFLKNQIKQSEESMNNEEFRYKAATIDYDKYAEAKGLKKVSDTEARKKMESSRKLTADAYDKANKMGYKDIGETSLDIAKPNKNEPRPQK